MFPRLLNEEALPLGTLPSDFHGNSVKFTGLASYSPFPSLLHPWLQPQAVDVPGDMASPFFPGVSSVREHWSPELLSKPSLILYGTEVSHQLSTSKNSTNAVSSAESLGTEGT